MDINPTNVVFVLSIAYQKIYNGLNVALKSKVVAGEAE